MAGTKHALLIGINRYPYLDNKDLKGCLNDVDLLGQVLQDRFGFPASNMAFLKDDEATRDNILSAFDGLVERIDDDDIVTVVYAGHGSRLRDPHGGADLLESMVTYDSGRGDLGPNRDVLDYEVDWFVQRLNHKTPYVTLLFDCCHSGSVTRDAFGSLTREVEPDTRSIEEAFPDTLPPLPPRGSGELTDAPGAGGWLPGSRSAVVIAACDAAELANEHQVFEGDTLIRHGALSWFLSRELLKAGSGSTWRDLFEKIAPAINGEHPRQHPQMEGKADEVLFGTEELTPSAYLTVKSVDEEGVELGGGAAHGVTCDSVYAIHPHGTHAAGPEGTELVLVRIESVQATTCRGVFEAEPTEDLAEGMRAFARSIELTDPALRVCVHVPDAKDLEGRQLSTMLASSDLIEVVSMDEPADVLVRLLAPRTFLEDDAPMPGLGKLPTWTWAAVGGDGRLVVKKQPATKAAFKKLLTGLEGVARYRNLLAIRNEDALSAMDGAVLLEAQRYAESRMAFVPATSEPEVGVVLFEEGEKAEFVITNGHDEAVYVTLVQFGANGAIDLMLPMVGHPTYNAGGVKLEPGEQVEVARGYYHQDKRYRAAVAEGLPLHLPKDFPWAAEPGEAADSGMVVLKLLVTQEPTDFSFLAQGATRNITGSKHPLAKMAALYGGGKGTRSFLPTPVDTEPEADWTVVDLPIAVRRPLKGQALPGDGAMDVGPVLLKAPGLAGMVSFERGMSERTRSLGGSLDPLDGALDSAGMRSVMTIEVDDTKKTATRSVGETPRMPDGSEAIELTLPDPGHACAQLVMYTDESGAIHWGFPEVMPDGSQKVMLPMRIAETAAPEASATRSLLSRAGKKLFRVVAYSPAKTLVDRAAKAGISRWEDENRPYGVRRFSPENYEASTNYRPGERGPRQFQDNDWRDMAKGRALLMVHGTFSRSWMAFGGFDKATVQRLYDLYEGRLFAFDHKTLSDDPDDNLAWFIEKMPAGVSLDLDIISHSRGGLLGRVFAERGPQRSGGRIKVGRVVMAGAPNNGTILTNAENLKTYINVVTNTLNAFPVPGPQDVLEGVLELAKLVAAGAIDALRGLQSMRPDGPWLRALNQPTGSPEAGAHYYGLGSSFREDCDGFKHLPEGFRTLATGKLANEIFKMTNDLVVPAEGVFLDNGSDRFPLRPENILFFGSSGDRGGELMGIDHSGYFAQPEARGRILEWLSAPPS